MSLEQPKILNLLFPIFVSIAKENGITFLAGCVFGAAHELRKKGIGDRRNYDSNRVTSLGAKAARDSVGTILQMLNGPQNSFSSRFGNAWLPIDNRRDRLDRDFGDSSNVNDCNFTDRRHWEDER